MKGCACAQAGQKLKLKKLEKLFLSKLSSLHGPDTARQWQQAGLLLPKVRHCLAAYSIMSGATTLEKYSRPQSTHITAAACCHQNIPRKHMPQLPGGADQP